MKGNRKRKKGKGLNSKILGGTIGSISLLLIVCCGIMILSMRRLTDDLLLDNLQPMARQSAKNVEANIHILADRMMSIAGDSRLLGTEEEQRATLDSALEIYELHTLALYGLDGHLMQGNDASPDDLDTDFFSLLRETDNLTTSDSTIFHNQLGITIGMPVKAGEETVSYVVGVYKYDALNDILNDIHVGRHGHAIIVSQEGTIVGYSDQNVVLQGTSLTELRGTGYQEASARVISRETGAIEASTGQETMFLAYSPIRGTQWSLMVEMPKTDYAYLIDRAILVTCLAALFLMAASIFWNARLSRSISVPIGTVTRRMVGLSDGNLHDAVEQAHTGDELELLTSTLGTTVDSMNHYISEIDRVLNHIASGNLDVAPEGDYKGDFSLIRDSLSHIIDSMNDTMGNFQMVAVQLSEVAERLSHQSQQLYQASVDQSQSAEQLVDEVSGVKNHLEKVTGAANETKGKAGEISQMIQSAGSQMDKLSQAMGGISGNAHEISRVAKSIEDIASQTSILAVNASIEAARAGAAGKGFAVVAGEVQKLATESAETAKQVTAMAGNTNAIVEEGVKMTSDTSRFIHSISSVSTEINGFTQRLFDAVTDQEKALSNMEEKIGTISNIADRNQQSAKESEESSSNLSQEARKLQEQVHRFILKKGGPQR